MENYALPERFYPYFPLGFTTEDFGIGKRISTLSGCDLYVYKHDLEVRAAILFGILFPADCSTMTRGINIVRGAERVAAAAKEAGETIEAITVETLLEKPWSDGGRAFVQLYGQIGSPSAVREYQGIITGYNMNEVSAAFVIYQGTKPLDTFVGKYLRILMEATKKSTFCPEGMSTYNYRLEMRELIQTVQRETGIIQENKNLEKEIIGYNEQLHLAGLSRISDFDNISQKLASKETTASSDKRQVS